jgi:Fe-Mn family superoxide dismutase
MDKSRRNFLRKSSLLALTGLGTQLISDKLLHAMEPGKKFLTNEVFVLPPMPYGYDGLEPHIDKMTMEIHHTKHHQAYVNNLNKAVAEGNITGTLEEIIRKVSVHPPAVRNNGGGHWNHSFFWKLMKPGGGGPPAGKIADAITGTFGTFEAFKTGIEEAGLKRFGSGWAWLTLDSNKKLIIGSTPNQDNPLMDVSELKGTPILGVDVWEHAYYLKYQNKRGDYLKAWWNVINWDEVNRNFDLAQK